MMRSGKSYDDDDDDDVDDDEKEVSIHGSSRKRKQQMRGLEKYVSGSPNKQIKNKSLE